MQRDYRSSPGRSIECARTGPLRAAPDVFVSPLRGSPRKRRALPGGTFHSGGIMTIANAGIVFLLRMRERRELRKRLRAGERAPHEHPGPGSIERTLRSRPALAAILLAGLSLRAWAFAASSSLGLDEVLLSRNILGLPLRDLLTRPLLLDQVAPRGFLLLEKLAVLALGPGELALRLFPFVTGIVGLLLFRRLALRSLEGLAAPFALAIFAVGVPFLRFGAEVKQYEVDATAAVLLLLFALDLRARDTSVRQRLAIGLGGFVIVWFSQAAVVMMAGIGLAFGMTWLSGRDRRTQGALFVTLPIWAAACALATLAGFRSMTPVRLAAASAEAFTVQPMPTDPRPGCRPWASPSPLDSFP